MVRGDCVLSLSWEGLAAICRHLAEQVAADYQPDLVVGVARGGTLPGTLIALLLRRDFQSLRVPVNGSAPTLPVYLPAAELIADRRVLVVDERAPDDSALRWAAEALQGLGAREVRTLTLFAARQRTADYAGPEVTVPVLQPWIRDVVVSPPASAVASASAPAEQSGSVPETGAHQ